MTDRYLNLPVVVVTVLVVCIETDIIRCSHLSVFLHCVSKTSHLYNLL